MRARIVTQKRPPTNPNVPRHASNANWVKQQRLKGPSTVMLAMLEHLAKPKVFDQHARLVFFKTTKAKRNASNAHWEKHTSTPKQHAVVVTLERLAAGTVFAKRVRLGSIKIPKVKKNAVAFVPRLEKCPTMRARGVNCHHGVPAKWGNI